MRMKKKPRWKRVLLWSSLSLVVILIASLFVMDYAVNKVLRSMGDMDIILEELDAADSTNTSPTTDNSIDAVTDIPSKDESAFPDETLNNSEAEEQEPDRASENAEAEAPTQADTPHDNKEPAYKAEVSTNKAKEIEESASISEKATVATLLMKNLNADDMKLLSSLASGGLNLDEKKAARTLILEKLTEDEYNKLISIAQKFGVSQGKQYDEVIKEE